MSKNRDQRRSRAQRDSQPRGQGPYAPAACTGFSRRGFLRLAGFGAGGAMAAGCVRAPAEQAIPYLAPPEEVIPGRALYYATTCQACPAACGMLAKCVAGRPIKLEGSPEHPLSRGGLCAVGQASLLGLYDDLRLQTPLAHGSATTWGALDGEIAGRLEAIRSQGGRVRFLTPTVVSPTQRTVMDRFLAGFEDGRLVEFDRLSSSAIGEAHLQTHGVDLVPRYRFDQARVIVSFDADFLGTWMAPVEFSAGYRQGRNPESGRQGFSFHAQFESRMSLTGANADQRLVIPPASLGPVMARLLHHLAAQRGWQTRFPTPAPSSIETQLEELAGRLWAARGTSLVVCGSQDLDHQLLCNGINEALGNYSSTIDIERPSLRHQGSDSALLELIGELASQSVDALFIAGMNPVYSLPAGRRLGQSISQADLVVDFVERPDETSGLATYVCPVPHNLESWSDAEPVDGLRSLCQPASRPLGGTRPLVESLSLWMGDPRSSLAILKDEWETTVFPRSASRLSFQDFWDRSLHDGVAAVSPQGSPAASFSPEALPGSLAQPAETDSLTLVAYPKAAILDGSQSYNAWLQELPDPVSKVTWGNYACLSPAAAASLSLREGDMVRLSTSEGEVTLPVFLQPGQHDGIVAVALGYGGEATARFAGIGPQWIESQPSIGEDGRVGQNVAPLLDFEKGRLRFCGAKVELKSTGARRGLACTQTHHHIEVPRHLRTPGQEPRPIARETTMDALLAGAPFHQDRHPVEELWPEDHTYPGHHWGMAIDLTACTGCSACVVACQVENNTPVVGKDEVRRNREMHWLRVDRYYTQREDAPSVVFQPMMCAQCDHAPCETVCPVLATVHSSEGLNQQVYNRCVGTRYCANNCPYKVRRFNWFDYARDPLAELALNPNVTVRSRGVMEKCTFCVQRIQEERLESRRQGVPPADGQIRTACQQSCPSRAIVFGDMNDPDSGVSRLLSSPRAYHVLAELNVRPSVAYLARVRNRAQEKEGRHA